MYFFSSHHLVCLCICCGVFLLLFFFSCLYADHSKCIVVSGAVVPVLSLLFFAMWFVLRGCLLCVLPCVVLFLCFPVHLALLLPRFGRGRLVLVCSVCSCLVLSCFVFLWEGLRFVIVALPGLFSYLFVAWERQWLMMAAFVTISIQATHPRKARQPAPYFPERSSQYLIGPTQIAKRQTGQ